MAVGASQRRSVHEPGFDVGEAPFVVARQVQAEVVVVDRGQLELRQTLRPRDRGLDPQRSLEIPGGPTGGEQQPAGTPRKRALECPQRGLEQARGGR